MEITSVDRYIVRKLLLKNHIKDDVPVEVRLAPLNSESVFVALEYRIVMPKDKRVWMRILMLIRKFFRGDEEWSLLREFSFKNPTYDDGRWHPRCYNYYTDNLSEILERCRSEFKTMGDVRRHNKKELLKYKKYCERRDAENLRRYMIIE